MNDRVTSFDGISGCQPETVAENAFACYAASIAQPIGAIGPHLGNMLRHLALTCRFDCRFHDIHELDDSGVSRVAPQRQDFVDDDAWEDAVAEWEWSPKPWCRVQLNDSLSLADYLIGRLQWTTNSRRYRFSRPGPLLGLFRSATYDPPKHLQDDHHTHWVSDFAHTVASAVGNPAHVYDTNHILDLSSVDQHAFEWDCFFDEALACVGSSAVVMLWMGHSRHYG